MKKLLMVFLLLISGFAYANSIQGIPNEYWSLNLTREQVNQLNNVADRYDNAIKTQEQFIFNVSRTVQNLSSVKNKNSMQMQALGMNMESLNWANARRNLLIQNKYQEMNSFLSQEQLSKLSSIQQQYTPRLLNQNTISIY